MKTLCALCLFLASSPSFADSSSINQFFASILGSWSGSGTVVTYLGNPGTYQISVQQTATAVAPGQWNVTSIVDGEEAAGTTRNTYQLNGDTLVLYTTQYSAPLELATATPTELSFTMEHTDSVTDAEVEVVRSMTLTAPHQLQVLADIYQDGSLVEEFNYTLSN